LRRTALFLLLLLAPVAAARAEEPTAAARLVADIRPFALPPGAGSTPHRLTPAGDRLFFVADDGFSGVELWAIGPEPAGLRQVADLCPGACGTGVNALTPAGGLVYFVGWDPAHGGELWRSNGTAAGTYLLVDARPGPLGAHYLPLVADGSKLWFFLRRDGGSRQGLWTSDGTPRGTRQVAEMDAGWPLAVVRGALLFVGFDERHGFELWRSDGTAAGTGVLRDIRPGPAHGLSEAGVFALTAGDRLFFQADDGRSGVELWTSDGTAAGTHIVRDIAPGAASSHPFPGAAVAGRLYFVSYTAGRSRLWRSDGSAAGTHPVRGFPTRASYVPEFLAAGRSLFFVENLEDGATELWRADGEAARRLRRWEGPPSGGGRAGVGQLATAGDAVVFLVWEPWPAPQRLWRTDGTPAGTRPLRAVAGAFGLVAFGGAAWFAAETAAQGTELWRSDGTAAGTALYADLHRGDRSSSPAELAALGDRLVFTADDGVHGRELWRSDGSRAGTALVGDLLPPPPRGGEPRPLVLGRAGDALLVATPDGALWRTRGASGDLERLRGGLGWIYPAAATGAAVFFFSNLGEGDGWTLSLWRSDGTAAGTEPLAEVAHIPFPDIPVGPPQVTEVAVSADGEIWFLHFDGSLWRSDGTQAGTGVAVEDPCAGACGWVHDLVAAGDAVYFAAREHVPERVRESLWRSDGTAAGTFRLRVVHDLAQSELRSAWHLVHQVTAAGDRLFFAGDDGRTGLELWTSDGTAEGTRRVRDLRPGRAGSDPAWITPAGHGVFFAALVPPHGQELWWSDGTPEGTRLVRDIGPGRADSFPQELAVVAGVLHFAAFTPEHGLEAWRSDGTAAGTRLLADVLPGPASSAPRLFTRAGGDLFFVAGRPRFGYELFAIDEAGE
jgi:ELWxxDGT repeat protein